MGSQLVLLMDTVMLICLHIRKRRADGTGSNVDGRDRSGCALNAEAYGKSKLPIFSHKKTNICTPLFIQRSIETITRNHKDLWGYGWSSLQDYIHDGWCSSASQTAWCDVELDWNQHYYTIVHLFIPNVASFPIYDGKIKNKCPITQIQICTYLFTPIGVCLKHR